MSDKDAQEIDQLMDDDPWVEDDDDDPNVFKVRGPLDVAQGSMLTTQELHRLIHEGQIDLNPDYQRDVVWPESKQIRLIDSLFRNFYIPPIVFAIRPDEDGEMVRICVDGKQRLTSIQKFFDGQVPHKDPVTGRSWYYTSPENLRSSRLEVPEYWKKVFASKTIICAEYTNLTATMEREIFQRVQLGMALTAAEKLQAISSPWGQWISQLQTKWVVPDTGLASVLDWDIRRGRDFQNFASMIYICDNLPTTYTTPTPQKLENWIANDRAPPASFKDSIEEVLTEMWYIASTPSLSFCFKKPKERVAPVEFVFIGVLLFLMRHATHEERAKKIFDMRKYIREHFRDVRNNSKVVKALWEFLDRNLTDSSGPSKSNTGGPKTRNASGSKRRKQQESSDGEDSDDHTYRQPRGTQKARRGRR
ncbi:hypothetical protein NEOLEDRAFT_1131787 [Neolentinus lepideus HHB14362 ss-1]|uniref:GmrSD restriction endonucleases N-terminal domain-containing protein n=1 Tax=Neolentinus lepideus HHB14362 ss-1 TaxID=1314782 RepID=A0A165TJH0_9AGAM|nr:hypothetical protein NEOLEDRAFT_1131787 [Neolentinus lepideus HHB14362 ss-1]